MATRSRRLAAAALVFIAGACAPHIPAIDFASLPVAAVSRSADAANEPFTVPPPPFSEGVFPCSRCHGSPDAAEAGPFMPHAKHVAKGLECEDCHEPDDEGAYAPADPEMCEECHEDPEKDTEGARAYFTAMRDEDGEIAFPDRWRTQDAIPAHATHAEADVACAECHGETTNGPLLKPGSAVLMRRCTDCHEAQQLASKCDTCHKELRGHPHPQIELEHAEEQRGCLDCHDPGDRDQLRLANGTAVPFEESYRLCGQCHGPKLRDWRIGLHGKITGSWSGRREYLLCAHCHDPHAPAFAPMKPLPPPPRPEEVR